MAKGERIKALREQLGMTQDELAEKLGTTKQNIYKYETGVVTNIPSDKIEQMAALFGVHPSYLMGWDNQDQNSGQQTYYNDPETEALAQLIHDTPGLRALCLASKGLPESDLQFMTDMANRFKENAGE